METNELRQNLEDGGGPGNGESPSGPARDKPGPGEQEPSMEEMLAAASAMSARLYSRDIVKVKVVQVAGDHVLVDIGEKKEAVIPAADFKEEKMPEVGAEVIAVLERKGGEGGHAVLSHRKAREKAAWEWAGKMFEAREIVRGRVAEAVKGGYIVDISGLKAFMPLSLSEIGGAHRHYLPENAKIKCYIAGFSAPERRLVVSRRQALEEEEKKRRALVLSDITPGRVVRVAASRVTAEGVSVRFHGIEGLIRAADLAWKRPEAELKNYKRGQSIKCKILSVDRENEKMAFGIKQLTPNPLDLLKKKFPYKAVLRVKIAAVSKSGAKAEVSEHVEGFISAGEYSHEGGGPREGQELKAVVIGIDPSTHELSLSVRKMEEMEDRKKVQQYLKGAPTLTLGQILLENSEDEGEA